MAKDFSIGIDIGGTKIAGGIVNKNGEIVKSSIVSTPKEGGEAIISSLIEMITSFQEIANVSNWELAGIGIGTAGQIDVKNGRVVSGTTNILNWNDIPLREKLSSIIKLPIWIDNDANVVALAESKVGAAKGEEDVVFLTLGTGVGGGVISSGNIIRGAWGGGAELGHLSVNFNGPDCNCGSKGCIEVYCSGTGIARLMREKMNQTTCSSMELVTVNEAEITSKHVVQWAKEGNELAQSVIDEMVEGLAFGIVNLIHSFNPTTIVLGGGVMEDGDWLRDLVEKRVRSLGMKSLVQPVTIKLAKLGNEAGLVGAAFQSWMNHHPTFEEEV
ncbi:hypothetical protein WQ54_10990 [Bacillus sp. SA1-12]|uniref:ROK family protein n=1 Tax=Bacillus sp. SA1-12 TaxID=1455638 RepID=UPI000625F4E5|nr:ROK family protein [Bacillus sp. SA1-12]KKI92098.1 hypothetical protein WQ54_10990 [Bacillus sp. SA1-12]